MPKYPKVDPKQPGFFLTEDETELHTRPELGDRMIHPKAARKKVSHPTPYEEAISFDNQRRRAGDLDRAIVGFADSGLAIYQKGGAYVSFVGETDGLEFVIAAEFVPRPNIAELSDAGRGMYYYLKKEGKL